MRGTNLRLRIWLPEDGFEGVHGGCVKENEFAETVLCSKDSPVSLLNRIDLGGILESVAVEYVSKNGGWLSARLAQSVN